MVDMILENYSGPRVDAEAAAGDAAELDDAVVAVRDSGVFELPLNIYNLPQNRMMKESESKVPRHSGTMGARSDAWSRLEWRWKAISRR